MKTYFVVSRIMEGFDSDVRFFQIIAASLEEAAAFAEGITTAKELGITPEELADMKEEIKGDLCPLAAHEETTAAYAADETDYGISSESEALAALALLKMWSTNNE